VNIIWNTENLKIIFTNSNKFSTFSSQCSLCLLCLHLRFPLNLFSCSLNCSQWPCLVWSVVAVAVLTNQQWQPRIAQKSNEIRIFRNVFQIAKIAYKIAWCLSSYIFIFCIFSGNCLCQLKVRVQVLMTKVKVQCFRIVIDILSEKSYTTALKAVHK